MERVPLPDGTPYEDIIGFSRAFRAGNLVFVSGTASWGLDRRLVGENDPYKQTAQCLRNINLILHSAGASLADIVRTRIYLTNMDRWQEVARAHREAFPDDHRPASTMIEVSRLADPLMLVEIEADAVLAD
ncbi:MAG: RidA family protein [Dehalococcoidia bacterium]|nr:RidA family protein [Dehalococcoidia bacterium]